MGKTYIREKRVLCGTEYMDVDIFPITQRQYKAGRARKNNPSRISQSNLNEKNAKRYFRQKAITNFNRYDYVATLSFDDKHLPKTDDEARRIFKNFVSRVNYLCKKNGLPPIKYMAVLEHTERIRYHFHAFISCGLPLTDIIDCWSAGQGKTKELLGLFKIEPIVFIEKAIEGLCEYMLKNPVGRRRWTQSKGLKEPKFPRPADNKYTRRKYERAAKDGDFYDKDYVRKIYPGWECSDATVEYNELMGWTVYLKMRRE